MAGPNERSEQTKRASGPLEQISSVFLNQLDECGRERKRLKHLVAVLVGNAEAFSLPVVAEAYDHGLYLLAVYRVHVFEKAMQDNFRAISRIRKFYIDPWYTLKGCARLACRIVDARK